MSSAVRRAGRSLLWILVVLALGVGAYRLLTAAALSGGTPAFSSLRTDPFGSSVLFGAYRRAGLSVLRGYDAQSVASLQPNRTVAFVISPGAWANDLAAQLYTFAQRGGFVVLAGPPAPPPTAAPGSPAVSDAMEPPQATLDDLLGARLQFLKLGAAAVALAHTAQPVAGLLPPDAHPLPLLDPSATLQLSHAWTPLYQAGGHTYMAMRQVGQGRVILASEAAFLSNDELARSSDAALLSWVTGGRTVIWVDETLHGLEQSHGVLWLLRRYRLLPALAWLLFTCGLLMWGAATSLERAPDPSDADDPATVPIAGASGGYARLLQRAIPAQELLAACRSQFVRWNPRQAGKLPSSSTPASARPSDIVAEFRRLQRWACDYAIQERKT